GYRPAARATLPEEASSDDLIPGVDAYNIVLGIFAAAAVLGLFPLWFAVYLTLTR
ncbi:MAG: hypothetical protein IT326_07850, partial [Anaerolineae bacterium]|nr:hypothetical protein [Anaerolineae bacterium]